MPIPPFGLTSKILLLAAVFAAFLRIEPRQVRGVVHCMCNPEAL